MITGRKPKPTQLKLVTSIHMQTQDFRVSFNEAR